MNNHPNKLVKKHTLLLVGFSGGLIAAFFPRLISILSPSSEAVSVQLFTYEYIGAGVVFSLMVGVAMIWLYDGTTEHTKNLFLSALALPAVLSGGINMVSVSAKAGQTINALHDQTSRLQEQVERQNAVGVQDLDFSEFEEVDLNAMIPSLLGISSAHAMDVTQKVPVDHGIVRITTPHLEKSYVLLYGEADSKVELAALYEDLKQKQVTDTKPLLVDGKYYLLGDERKTKTQALIDILEIRKRVGVEPSLIRIK